MKNKSEFSAQDILSNADLMACRDRWQLVKLARQLKNSPDDGELRRLNDRYNESVDWVEQRKNQVPDISISSELPVGERAAEIAEVLNHSQVVILAGETGSGKTTQLPKICLQIGRGQRGMIGHTQPRRLAARAVASRIADELNVQVGALVGCHVRFHDQFQDATQIKLMTDGILLAEMQQDRFLSRYDTLIIDEAHERSLNIDFLLGYIKQILPKRPDLKVIITSATIDLEKFSRHFDNAPVVEVSGRTYPVDTRYYPPDRWATQRSVTSTSARGGSCIRTSRASTRPSRRGRSPASCASTRSPAA